MRARPKVPAIQPPSPATAAAGHRPSAVDWSEEAATTLQLFCQWQQTGDDGARDEIVRHYLPLARRLARRYAGAIEPFEDLFQVASVGLLAAMQRFDPARGVAFTAFAIPTILGELKRHFRDTGWATHVPRHAQELAQQVKTASEELSSRSHRSPRVEEIAQYLELPTEDVLAGLHAATAHFSISLDAPLTSADDEEPVALSESVGTVDEGYALVETTSALSEELGRLTADERRALTLRLEDDMKQSEIAKRLGCSQMQVSRLLRKAAETLRQANAI